MRRHSKRSGLGFVYRRDGFCRQGGLLRIAQDTANTLRSAQPNRQLFTLTGNGGVALLGTTPNPLVADAGAPDHRWLRLSLGLWDRDSGSPQRTHGKLVAQLS